MGLKFKDTPNYEYIISKFIEIYEEISDKKGRFDWENFRDAEAKFMMI